METRTLTGFFLTGTDTGCGKTEITCGMMHYLRARGVRVAGMKPVASGAVAVDGRMRNEDALLVQAQQSGETLYDWVNPYAFGPPVAPHLAAADAGVEIDFARIRVSAERLFEQRDCILVEGVGGWRVPLSGGKTVAHLAGYLDLPVILVVGLKLGCINHALLTAEAIRRDGIVLAGWVANVVEPAMLLQQENIETLVSVLEAPLLGVVPHLGSVKAARVADYLDLTAVGFG